MSELSWENLDWRRLERLRSLFLDPESIDGPYWRDEEDLLAYDLTFAARIGWKWDAVLRGMRLRGWTPGSTRIYDWGCGTGMATRRLLASFPDHPWTGATIWDHSPLATEYAREVLRRDHPDLAVEIAPPDQLPGDSIVLVSHALGEATEDDLRVLWDRAGAEGAARSVVVVEPGTYESSRAVIVVRESLRKHFQVVAPCTHQDVCGLLTEENVRHWCHHFARTPVEVFMDGNWARFAETMEIDLRSLPYSFIALDKQSPPERGDESRILGRPRLYKGYCRILSCQASGVHEYEMQKRTNKALWKALKKGRHAGLFHWETEGDRIVGGREMGEGN